MKLIPGIAVYVIGSIVRIDHREGQPERDTQCAVKLQDGGLINCTAFSVVAQETIRQGKPAPFTQELVKDWCDKNDFHFDTKKKWNEAYERKKATSDAYAQVQILTELRDKLQGDLDQRDSELQSLRSQLEDARNWDLYLATFDANALTMARDKIDAKLAEIASAAANAKVTLDNGYVLGIGDVVYLKAGTKSLGAVVAIGDGPVSNVTVQWPEESGGETLMYPATELTTEEPMPAPAEIDAAGTKEAPKAEKKKKSGRKRRTRKGK